MLSYTSCAFFCPQMYASSFILSVPPLLQPQRLKMAEKKEMLSKNSCSVSAAAWIKIASLVLNPRECSSPVIRYNTGGEWRGWFKGWGGQGFISCRCPSRIEQRCGWMDCHSTQRVTASQPQSKNRLLFSPASARASMDVRP